jgi:hypothetical protein
MLLGRANRVLPSLAFGLFSLTLHDLGLSAG